MFGVIHGCRIFLPILEAQDEAHIVNTASVAGIYSYTYLHPYNAAKAAVVALSEGMWREFGAEKPQCRRLGPAAGFDRDIDHRR